MIDDAFDRLKERAAIARGGIAGAPRKTRCASCGRTEASVVCSLCNRSKVDFTRLDKMRAKSCPHPGGEEAERLAHPIPHEPRVGIVWEYAIGLLVSFCVLVCIASVAFALLAFVYVLSGSAATEQKAYDADALELQDAKTDARAGYPISQPYESLEAYVRKGVKHER